MFADREESGSEKEGDESLSVSISGYNKYLPSFG